MSGYIYVSKKENEKVVLFSTYDCEPSEYDKICMIQIRMVLHTDRTMELLFKHNGKRYSETK